MNQDELVKCFEQVCQETRRRVDQIKDSDWTKSTPCTDWDVKDLLKHTTNELLWMVPLFEGRTIKEVGDKFEGDILGQDPQMAWQTAAICAIAALRQPGAAKKTVHLSYGDYPGLFYGQEMLVDQTIHTWDLAKGLGVNTKMDQGLVETVYKLFTNRAEEWRQGGALGPAVKVPKDSDVLTKLVALAGRQP